jgi:hypothetical protein
MRLPEPRGPLSAFLAERLALPVHALPESPAAPGDPLADEDHALSLYTCYELHYRSFDGVDEDWEWEPSLLALRRELERGLEARLVDEIGFEDPAAADIPALLRDLLAGAPGPSVARHLASQGTLGEFCEFVVHRSAYQLKENDPHAFALPRLEGRAKVAMAEIQSDEFGGGRPERLHARLFRDTMEALGLDGRYGAYLDVIPAPSLVTVNVMSLFGLHRRWRGAVAGHLAMLEMDSSLPNRRYGNGLRRLGLGAEATEFFDEHVEADAVHEQIAAHDLAGALALDEPALAPDVVFGARAMLTVEARMGEHLLSAWDEGRTSLLRALPEPDARLVAH